MTLHLFITLENSLCRSPSIDAFYSMFIDDDDDDDDVDLTDCFLCLPQSNMLLVPISYEWLWVGICL
jgi:hypothetical protein